MAQADANTPASDRSDPKWIEAVIRWLHREAHELDSLPKVQITIDRAGDTVRYDKRVTGTIPVERE